MERGLVIQTPITSSFFISNVKDTSDHVINLNNDTILIQFYKNQIFLNHKYYGESMKGDTVRLNYNGTLEVIRKRGK